MAEITNEIDWLKACNHLVFENYADADAWGWDGYTSDTMSDVQKTAKHLWRLGREEYYKYFNPIHRAISERTDQRQPPASSNGFFRSRAKAG